MTDWRKRDLRGGYTQEQLQEAFDLVKPKPHWKAAIAAKVPLDTDMKLLDFAIGYFTGGNISFQQECANHIYVEAPGYWECIGA